MASIAAGFVLLIIRGVALWLVVPVSVLTYPAIRVLGNRVTVAQTMGWADLNLIALLQRAFPRRAFPNRVSFVGWRAMASVTHRISLIDPA